MSESNGPLPAIIGFGVGLLFGIMLQLSRIAAALEVLAGLK